MVLRSLEGDQIKCAVCLQFPTTNYKALLTSLDLAKATNATSIIIRSDFQVIVRHVNEDYEAEGEQIKKYLSLVKKQIGLGFMVDLVQIIREENEQADRLPKVASAEHMTISSQVLSFVQHSPTIEKIDVQVIPMGFD